MSTRNMTVSDVEQAALDALAHGSQDVALVMDEQTFRAFYDRNARAVWAYLVRLTGDRHAADDLLQETFYRFLRAGAAYENETHRRNTLFRIATNLSRDSYRRKRVRPLLEPQTTEPASPGDGAAEFERRTDLTRALGVLKPRERAMLWLAYAEGSSHREIADTLGLKTASIKLLLFRARRRLADVMRRGRHATT